MAISGELCILLTTPFRTPFTAVEEIISETTPQDRKRRRNPESIVRPIYGAQALARSRPLGCRHFEKIAGLYSESGAQGGRSGSYVVGVRIVCCSFHGTFDPLREGWCTIAQPPPGGNELAVQRGKRGQQQRRCVSVYILAVPLASLVARRRHRAPSFSAFPRPESPTKWPPASSSSSFIRAGKPTPAASCRRRCRRRPPLLLLRSNTRRDADLAISVSSCPPGPPGHLPAPAPRGLGLL